MSSGLSGEKNAERFSSDTRRGRITLAFHACVWARGLTDIRSLASAADGVDKSAVKLRVDDYAPVAAALLSRSQEEVTQLYAAVGVETTWLKTRYFANRPSDAPLPLDVGAPDVTLIMLSRSMTARMAPPHDVIGLAAHTRTEPGRIGTCFTTACTWLRSTNPGPATSPP